MKLATTTGDFGRYTISQEECIRYIRKAGFKYADYNFGIDYRNGTGAFSDNWQAEMKKLKKAADEMGIRFVQSHAPMGTPIVKGENYEPFIEVNKRCIECCALLGIDRMVVHSGYEYGLTKEECFERNKEFYMRLLPLAQEKGVYILTENFNKMYKEGVFWVDNAVDLRALIDYVDHPYFHAVWDAGHANLQDMPQDEALRIVGHHVYALHIQDNMGDHDSHFFPFMGTMSLDAVMNGLKDIGYKGYFTFEANIFLPADKRRDSERGNALRTAPLNVRIKAEEMLYEIGKAILEAYDCYEE
ncbi:MAG: sugar phosphate isomerase/epimerase [Clostridia bacterium]|nr:sugar phosphate isomerase/epimerase [Clostridia bacterium]